MTFGMDWLYLHRTKVDCFNKVIECLDDNRERRILQGKKKPTSVSMVSAMQVKHSFRKGYVMFAMHISSDKGKESVEDEKIFKRYLVLRQYQDVFLVEILELPPHREVDFSIELVRGGTPTLKESYMMSTPDLVQLKFQLKDILEKGYIRPSVSLWGASVLFVKRKDGTLILCIDYR